MRRIVVALAALAALGGASASAQEFFSLLVAQLPVSQTLLEARTVTIEGVGVDRGLLRHIASEFRRQGRFELVVTRTEADLVVVLRAGKSDDIVYATVPVPGGGVLRGAVANDVLSLEVVDARAQEKPGPLAGPSEAPLWSDSREVQWTSRGAVLDLVKDLHRDIRNAPCG